MQKIDYLRNAETGRFSEAHPLFRPHGCLARNVGYAVDARPYQPGCGGAVMRQSNTTPATVRAALARFSERYLAAYNSDVDMQNKAHEAFIGALSYLDVFTSGNHGLTPEQAKELFTALESFEDLWGAPGGSALTPTQVVERFEVELHTLLVRSSSR
jgi:hypothetical protein